MSGPAISTNNLARIISVLILLLVEYGVGSKLAEKLGVTKQLS